MSAYKCVLYIFGASCLSVCSFCVCGLCFDISGGEGGVGGADPLLTLTHECVLSIWYEKISLVKRWLLGH